MQPSSEQASYDNGIPIMYCMDQPWFLTNALQLPLSGHADREVMTRASGDYIPGDNRGQWAVGKTAILSWSLSVFPYKVRWVVHLRVVMVGDKCGLRVWLGLRVRPSIERATSARMMQ